jgi:hypothetical protein
MVGDPGSSVLRIEVCAVRFAQCMKFCLVNPEHLRLVVQGHIKCTLSRSRIRIEASLSSRYQYRSILHHDFHILAETRLGVSGLLSDPHSCDVL